MKIMIDPAHGDNVGGKRSPDGALMEWKYSREICTEVIKRLKAEGYDAEITVNGTKEPGLSARARRVNSICAVMGASNVCLVSIHLNAAGAGQWMNARGWEAWTSVGQTKGDKLADCLYDAAEKYLPKGTPIRTDITDGDRDKEKNFTILYETKCAACLTENLFMDNRQDKTWLLSIEGREAIVSLHVAGIKAYVAKYGRK